MRDLAGEALLAVRLEDALQLVLAGGVEDVGGRGPVARLVHPHVEWRVGAVTEAAVELIELQAGDAEVEQHRVRGAGQDVGDLGVDGVHAFEAVTEAGEAFTGQTQGLGVTVDPDGAGLAEALEHGLGVATHAEGGVDVESAGALERGGESVEDLGEHDGHVTIGCEAA